MLPVVAGTRNTRRQIFLYSLPMAAAAVALSLGFIGLAAQVLANTAEEPAGMGPEKRLFGYSVIYLFVLFGALVADRWIAP
jgi:protoheme IX farnesyltransferase